MLKVPDPRVSGTVAGAVAIAESRTESDADTSADGPTLTDAGIVPPSGRIWFGMLSVSVVALLAAGCTTTSRVRVRPPKLAVTVAQPGPAPVATNVAVVLRGCTGTDAGTPTTCGLLLDSDTARTPADA